MFVFAAAAVFVFMFMFVFAVAVAVAFAFAFSLSLIIGSIFRICVAFFLRVVFTRFGINDDSEEA